MDANIAENADASFKKAAKISTEPPKENLYDLIRRNIECNIKPDIHINIGGIVFHCQKLVLQCYSEFFDELTNEVHTLELPEEKITPKAFKVAYNWMYADFPEMQREDIVDLLQAGNYLRIKGLVDQCWTCIDTYTVQSEDVAFDIYKEARLRNMKMLQEIMLDRIFKFFIVLVASNDFLELATEELCTLLRKNTIGINTECEILMSVVRWFGHDWNGRKEHVAKVLKLVRFKLMSPVFLTLLQRCVECEEIGRITKHAEVQPLIARGLSYAAVKGSQVDNETCLSFLAQMGFETPESRQFVYDRNCAYHRRQSSINMEYLTYKEFLEYIEVIKKKDKEYWRSLESA